MPQQVGHCNLNLLGTAPFANPDIQKLLNRSVLRSPGAFRERAGTPQVDISGVLG